MKDGIKIHPRQTKQLFRKDDNDKRLTVRPTIEQMKEYGIEHYKGKQFKYLMFVCDRRTMRRLKCECTEPLSKVYPKENALQWKKKDEKGKWITSSKPPYRTDVFIDKTMVNKVIALGQQSQERKSVYDR